MLANFANGKICISIIIEQVCATCAHSPSLLDIHIYSSLTSSVIWPADDGSSMNMVQCFQCDDANERENEREKNGAHPSKSQRMEKKRNSSEIIIMVAILTNLPPFKYCININEINENNKTLFTHTRASTVLVRSRARTCIQRNNSPDMVNAFNNASATNNFNVIKK